MFKMKKKYIEKEIHLIDNIRRIHFRLSACDIITFRILSNYCNLQPSFFFFFQKIREK